ncbi:MAG: bifunctional 4-hydroxy-2-oxoglutarate aldolase/2-dehydro-3-deoxy-phosphogluconate aldolase [Clostridia bacterium]|nr:bifunctional 4-hydroxy-2-oxoglutarate aldolase/2-dehydro-3-deoxy-phosphogluconate aldolase [Clostridia bacterium]
MDNIISELSLIGIVPVIKIDNADDALPLAEALIKGGLPCAEVTFRTDTAHDAIAAMTKQYPDLLVGAGTVLTTEQVDSAIEAGAKFIVSPGLNPKVVSYCQEKGIPVVPGINNPTGIEQALELGLDVVKFFPSEQSGGINMIKAMSAPYPKVRFMPTGGIGPANLLSYLSNKKIIACGGSWMVKPEVIAAHAFDVIEQSVREAVDLMLGFSLQHIGLQAQSEAEADALANELSSVFSFQTKKGSASSFVGSGLEIMNHPGRGAYGHIAIHANSVDRAVYHLSRRGVKFDESSATYNPDGSRKIIYLAKEHDRAGFAFHLTQD